jgi:NCS2 family nucleobase:cation symporter-2
LLIVGEKYGYWTMLGSAIVGGLFLFVMGFFAKYWRRLIKPVTSAAVMIAVGLELAVLGAEQFFSYDKVISLDPNEIYSFQTAWPLLLISAFTLIVALLWNSLVHGSKKYMHISVGLLAGYLLALVFNVCFPSLKIFDYSQYSFKTINDVFHVPLVVDFSQIKFEWAPILFVCITYLVSSSESISDMVATAHAAYGRGASDRELAGGLVVDGLISTISACFGSVPITTSTENVGYMGKTGIINKHVVGTGAVMMVILSFFPQVAVFLEQIPTAAIGGCMLTIYMSILVLGFEMLSRAGFTKKNVMVISVALGLGYGTSLLPVNFFNTITFPDGWVFVGFLMENPEVSVFLLALILSWAIPGGSNDRMVPFEKEELALAEVKEEKDIKEEDEKHDLKQSPAPTESNSNHS